MDDPRYDTVFFIFAIIIITAFFWAGGALWTLLGVVASLVLMLVVFFGAPHLILKAYDWISEKIRRHKK